MASLLLLGAGACDPSAPPETEVLVRVDGRTVTVRRFEERWRTVRKEMGELWTPDPRTRQRLERRLLRELIDETLLLVEADRRGITVPTERVASELERLRSGVGPREWRRYLIHNYIDEASWRRALTERLRIEALIDAELAHAGPVSEATLRERYRQERERFQRPKEVLLEQIVVADEAEANRLREQLRRGADFATLAREHSIGPEAARGGRLGYVREEDLPASFAPAFRLRPGRISEVVATEYGYHIFRVAAVRKPRARSFEEVRELLAKEVELDRRAAVRARLLARLRQEIPIEVDQGVWRRLRARLWRGNV